MFCCTLLYVHSSIAIILMGKRELIALLDLSHWCLVMVEWPLLFANLKDRFSRVDAHMANLGIHWLLPFLVVGESLIYFYKSVLT